MQQGQTLTEKYYRLKEEVEYYRERLHQLYEENGHMRMQLESMQKAIDKYERRFLLLEEHHICEKQLKAILNKRVTDVNFGTRTENMLRAADVEYIGQLVQLREKDVLKIPRIGIVALQDIKRNLEKLNLSLGMSVVYDRDLDTYLIKDQDEDMP